MYVQYCTVHMKMTPSVRHTTKVEPVYLGFVRLEGAAPPPGQTFNLSGVDGFWLLLVV